MLADNLVDCEIVLNTKQHIFLKFNDYRVRKISELNPI